MGIEAEAEAVDKGHRTEARRGPAPHARRPRGEPTNETRFEDPLTIIVTTNADSYVTVVLQFADGAVESFTGPYTQSGHLGRIEGVFPNDLGNIAVSEIEITNTGFTGRFEGGLVTSLWRDWCDMKYGRIGGVRREQNNATGQAFLWR